MTIDEEIEKIYESRTYRLGPTAEAYLLALEAISQMAPEQNDDAGKLNKAEVVGQMTLIAHQQPSEVAQPSKQPFHLPPSLVPLLLSTLAFVRGSEGGVPFLAAFLYAFRVVFALNVVDWLVLDWVVFCTLTPRFLVIPGSEGMAAYKDDLYHFGA